LRAGSDRGAPGTPVVTIPDHLAAPLIGEPDGQAFLLDSSMVLSDCPEMLVAMSARLGTVVGYGAETVSGSYWLVAARDGVLVRLSSSSMPV
jgi:hypothetical protein